MSFYARALFSFKVKEEKATVLRAKLYRNGSLFVVFRASSARKKREFDGSRLGELIIVFAWSVLSLFRFLNCKKWCSSSPRLLH